MSTTLTDAKKRVLELIKRRGATRAVEMAESLGLTDVAVRQHLAALEEMGLVEATALPPQGRGRPSTAWSLTALAAELFPDRHADLTVDLIEATRAALGEEGLLKIIDVRAKRQARHYREAIPAGASLKKRVEVLAALRTAEGYMAEVVQERPGSYLLIEHNCPICEAATNCQGLCQAELEVFRKALGKGVVIERLKHLLSEDDRCVYRVENRKQKTEI